jgi:hypothetical protein
MSLMGKKPTLSPEEIARARSAWRSHRILDILRNRPLKLKSGHTVTLAEDRNWMGMYKILHTEVGEKPFITSFEALASYFDEVDWTSTDGQ